MDRPNAPTLEMLFDRRVVERNIRKGLVTREDYEKYVAGLQDVAEQSEEIRAKLGEEEPHPVVRAPVTRPPVVSQASADDDASDDGLDGDDLDGDANDRDEEESGDDEG